MLSPSKKSYDKPRQCIKIQTHHFADNKSYSQRYIFSSSDVGMWELDHKESWAPKNWCFWTVVLEKTLESPLDSKEIKSVNPKGNELWILIIRTEADAPIFWPFDEKWLIGKDPDVRKDWGQGRSGTAEDEIASSFCCSCCSVSQSCTTICDTKDYSTQGFPVLHYLLEFAQTCVHWVDDAIQPSHPLSSPSPSALNLS